MDKSLIWMDYLFLFLFLFLFCCRPVREVAEGLERRRRESLDWADLEWRREMSVSSWSPIRAVSNPAVNERRMMERSVVSGSWGSRSGREEMEERVEMESAIWITSFQFTLIIISKFTRTHA